MRVMIASAAAATAIAIETAAIGIAAIVTAIATYGATDRGTRAAIARAAKIEPIPPSVDLKAANRIASPADSGRKRRVGNNLPARRRRSGRIKGSDRIRRSGRIKRRGRIKGSVTNNRPVATSLGPRAAATAPAMNAVSAAAEAGDVVGAADATAAKTHPTVHRAQAQQAQQAQARRPKARDRAAKAAMVRRHWRRGETVPPRRCRRRRRHRLEMSRLLHAPQRRRRRAPVPTTNTSCGHPPRATFLAPGLTSANGL